MSDQEQSTHHPACVVRASVVARVGAAAIRPDNPVCTAGAVVRFYFVFEIVNVRVNRA